MAGWRVLWVGKTQHRFVAEGIDYYRKRIAPLQTLEIVETRAGAHSGRDPEAARRREGEALLRRVGPQDAVVLLDERGRQPTTHELADLLARLQGERGRTLCFLVGGAYGVDEAVGLRADETVSLSRLTFPHQLVRVVLLEQLYRVLSLQAGHGYHHD
jgi:23S rRNA (pseudouridine1915-N3)-methyltransferase